MECASDSGVSMHRRAASCVAAKTAYNIGVVRRPRTTLTPSLPAVPSIVFQSASTRMAARWRPARLVVRTSANVLCTTVLRWTGLNIRRADIAKLSARLSVPAKGSGRAATSSRGSIVHASAQAESRPPVRMMQMPILDAIPARRQSTRCIGLSPDLGQWLSRSWGDSRYPSFPISATADFRETPGGGSRDSGFKRALAGTRRLEGARRYGGLAGPGPMRSGAPPRALIRKSCRVPKANRLGRE
ncbi:hypothetical protein ACVWXN_007991 [Bradyrhizobium sp. i1.4.4]